MGKAAEAEEEGEVAEAEEEEAEEEETEAEEEVHHSVTQPGTPHSRPDK